MSTPEEVHEGEIVEPGTALAAAAPRAELARVVSGTTPQAIMSNAGVIAGALKEVLREQKLTARMGGGREHVEIGGWQAAGTMLGALGGEPLHAETVWSRRILDETGKPESTRFTIFFKRNRVEVAAEVEGFSWEAKVEVRTPDGTVVGSAEAMCSRTEKTWCERDDFALRSMAETRAESRAYRKAIGWIINMAGYSATPAEEMGHDATAGPAFGAPAPDALKQEMLSAMTTLLGGGLAGMEAARRAGAAIAAGCGGYMPEAVAGSVVDLASHIPAPTFRVADDDFENGSGDQA